MRNQPNGDKKYNVGIYLRLSQEDGGAAQSESIVNQKEIAVEYALKQGWNIAECYIDDGYSGTNFNRPGFRQMLKDIELNKINAVITKDLSRLGRDYIDTGYYIERFFPLNNIRYIAVNDGVDTFATLSGAGDMTPFKTVIKNMCC